MPSSSFVSLAISPGLLKPISFTFTSRFLEVLWRFLESFLLFRHLSHFWVQEQPQIIRFHFRSTLLDPTQQPETSMGHSSSERLPHHHTIILASIVLSLHPQVCLSSARCSRFPRENSKTHTYLKFLVITLDSLTFQTSLPTKKLHRISLYISIYLLAH